VISTHLGSNIHYSSYFRNFTNLNLTDRSVHQHLWFIASGAVQYRCILCLKDMLLSFYSGKTNEEFCKEQASCHFLSVRPQNKELHSVSLHPYLLKRMKRLGPLSLKIRHSESFTFAFRYSTGCLNCKFFLKIYPHIIHVCAPSAYGITFTLNLIIKFRWIHVYCQLIQVPQLQ